MSEDQISTPLFLAILVILGFIVRYLFFNGAGANTGAQSPRSSEARLRAGEVAVERIQQMFPQTDRRAILWDLQRNGMNIQATIERILRGGLETV
jgi:coupling of ubiquitin conjugation to ER degradation protein 1